MTNALTIQQAEAINKKGFQLGHHARWLQKGAELDLECAKHNPKLTEIKRKLYIRGARKELKLAADLFTEAASLLNQTIMVHPSFFSNKDLVSKWLARAEECLALVKNSKA